MTEAVQDTMPYNPDRPTLRGRDTPVTPGIMLPTLSSTKKMSHIAPPGDDAE